MEVLKGDGGGGGGGGGAGGGLQGPFLGYTAGLLGACQDISAQLRETLEVERNGLEQFIAEAVAAAALGGGEAGGGRRPRLAEVLSSQPAPRHESKACQVDALGRDLKVALGELALVALCNASWPPPAAAAAAKPAESCVEAAVAATPVQVKAGWKRGSICSSAQRASGKGAGGSAAAMFSPLPAPEAAQLRPSPPVRGKNIQEMRKRFEHQQQQQQSQEVVQAWPSGTPPPKRQPRGAADRLSIGQETLAAATPLPSEEAPLLPGASGAGAEAEAEAAEAEAAEAPPKLAAKGEGAGEVEGAGAAPRRPSSSPAASSEAGRLSQAMQEAVRHCAEVAAVREVEEEEEERDGVASIEASPASSLDPAQQWSFDQGLVQARPTGSSCGVEEDLRSPEVPSPAPGDPDPHSVVAPSVADDRLQGASGSQEGIDMAPQEAGNASAQQLLGEGVRLASPPRFPNSCPQASVADDAHAVAQTPAAAAKEQSSPEANSSVCVDGADATPASLGSPPLDLGSSTEALEAKEALKENMGVAEEAPLAVAQELVGEVEALDAAACLMKGELVEEQRKGDGAAQEAAEELPQGMKEQPLAEDADVESPSGAEQDARSPGEDISEHAALGEAGLVDSVDATVVNDSEAQQVLAEAGIADSVCQGVAQETPVVTDPEVLVEGSNNPDADAATADAPPADPTPAAAPPLAPAPTPAPADAGAVDAAVADADTNAAATPPPAAPTPALEAAADAADAAANDAATAVATPPPSAPLAPPAPADAAAEGAAPAAAPPAAEPPAPVAPAPTAIEADAVAASSSSSAPSSSMGRPLEKDAAPREAKQQAAADSAALEAILQAASPQKCRTTPPRSGGRSPPSSSRPRPPATPCRARSPEPWEALRMKVALPPKRKEDNYDISDGEDSGQDEDKAKEARRKKAIPAWCDWGRDVRDFKQWMHVLTLQSEFDADTIFGGKVPRCNMKELFPDELYRSKKIERPRRKRGSSQDWSKDPLTRHECVAYKSKMGQMKTFSVEESEQPQLPTRPAFGSCA